jgi:HD superfamily phosphodiesterase
MDDLAMRVDGALEDHFGTDLRRISHARQVCRHALRIRKAHGGDFETVLCAALLHDVGIKPAEEKYGRCDGPYQEELGPPVAGEILERLGLDSQRIERVKEIIAHHHTPGAVGTAEFACVWDADMVVNFGDSLKGKSPVSRERFLARNFLTEEGRRIAREGWGG